MSSERMRWPTPHVCGRLPLARRDDVSQTGIGKPTLNIVAYDPVLQVAG